MESLSYTYAAREYEVGDSLFQSTHSRDQLFSLIGSQPSSPLNLRSSAAVSLAGGVILSSALAPMPAEATLRRGETCDAVVELQNALIAAGHDTGVPDGAFGGITEFAVLRFQQTRGLVADSIVGPNTAAALGLDADISCNDDVNSVAATVNSSVPQDVLALVEVVTEGSRLNVRSGPGIDTAIIGSLGDGSVTALSGATAEGWLELAEGGWVSADWVIPSGSIPSAVSAFTPETVTETLTETATDFTRFVQIATNGGALNVRQGPGADFAVVDALGNGAIVATTDEIVGNWVQLSEGGWVSLDWVNAAS